MKVTIDDVALNDDTLTMAIKVKDFTEHFDARYSDITRSVESVISAKIAEMFLERQSSALLAKLDFDLIVDRTNAEIALRVLNRDRG